MTEELKIRLDSLPDSPGCYLMKSEGEIIYIGKAKNLKHRVRQYFKAPETTRPRCARWSSGWTTSKPCWWTASLRR